MVARPAAAENWIAWVGNLGANTLVAFDTETGARRARISLDDYEATQISDVAISSDGSLLYVANAFSILVLDGTTGAHLRTIPTDCSSNRIVAAPNDAQFLTFAEWNCQRVSLVAPKEERTIDLVDVSDTHSEGVIPGIAFSPDGSLAYLNVGWFDGLLDRGLAELWVIDVATGETLRKRELESAGEVAISPDGGVAYVSGWQGATVIDTESLQTVAQVLTERQPVGFVFSPDGSRAYISAGNVLFIVDTKTHEALSSISLTAGAGRPAITPDGRRLLVPLADVLGTVAVIDTLSAQVIDHITVGPRPIAVAVMALPQAVATPTATSPATPERTPAPPQACVVAAHSQGLSFIDPDAGRVAATMAVGEIFAGAYDLAIAPDGERIYATTAGFGQTGAVAFIDAPTHSIAGRLDVGCNPRAIAVHPAGQFAYIGQDACPSSSIAVLDLELEEIAAGFFVHGATSWIQDIIFAPDGARAYFISDQSWDQGWRNPIAIDTSTHTSIGTVPPTPTERYEGYAQYGRSVAITPNGQYLYVPRPWIELSRISEINLFLDNTVREISLPVRGEPDRIVLSPDGQTIFVSVLPRFSCKDHPATGHCIYKSDAVVAVDRASGAWTAVKTVPGFLEDLAIASDGNQLYALVEDSIAIIETHSMEIVDMIPLPGGVSAMVSGVVRGGCRSNEPPSPVPTRSPTSTWRPRVTITPGPSATPTVVPAECESGCVAIEVQHVRALPGETVTLEVRLLPGDFSVAGLQTEIAFGPTTGIASRFDDVPLCEAVGSFAAGAADFDFDPWYCWVGIDCTSLKVLLYAREDEGAIAEETAIFRCPLSIPKDAQPGQYPFEVSKVAVTDAIGRLLPARGIGGVVEVFPDNGTPIPPLSTKTPTRQPHTKTPNPTATAESPTNAATPIATTTPDERPSVRIRVDSAAGIPGAETTVGVRIDTDTNTVVGVQNDLSFEPEAQIIRCRSNPDIGKSVVFAFRPAGCVRGSNCEAVRAIVYSIDDFNPIPDGALLYTCTVRVVNAAPGSYPIETSNIVAAGPGGVRLPSAGHDGAILVAADSSGSEPSGLGRPSSDQGSGCEIRQPSSNTSGFWMTMLLGLLACSRRRYQPLAGKAISPRLRRGPANLTQLR